MAKKLAFSKFPSKAAWLREAFRTGLLTEEDTATSATKKMHDAGAPKKKKVAPIELHNARDAVASETEKVPASLDRDDAGVLDATLRTALKYWQGGESPSERIAVLREEIALLEPLAALEAEGAWPAQS